MGIIMRRLTGPGNTARKIALAGAIVYSAFCFSSKGPALAQVPKVEEVRKNFDYEAAIAKALKTRMITPWKPLKITQERADEIREILDKYLPSMKNTKELLRSMPDTALELCIAVAERNMDKGEAEKAAEYLAKYAETIQMKKLGLFDFRFCDVVGRDFNEIDFRKPDEDLTDEEHKARQTGKARFFSKRGIETFKTAEGIINYMKWRYENPSFIKMYGVKGTLP